MQFYILYILCKRVSCTVHSQPVPVYLSVAIKVIEMVGGQMADLLATEVPAMSLVQ
jgi:hypothetical protein